MNDFLGEWNKIKIITGDIEEFLYACKLVCVRKATISGHDIGDILQHYYQSASTDISYHLFCSKCTFEIVLELIQFSGGEPQINLIGDTLETKCPTIQELKS